MNLKVVLKKNTMLLALIIVSLFFAIGTHGSILAPANITNLISQNSYVVILAVGMLLCILTGGNIDLSVGSIVALIGAIAGTLIVNHNVNIWVTILICLVVGGLIGVWQALWIAHFRIPPFIVTLAGMLIWRGVALIVLDGLTISPFPEKYTNLFNSYFGVGTPTIIVGVVLCIIVVLAEVRSYLSKKKKGYAVGNIWANIGKMALFCVVIMAVAVKLSQYKGVPAVLVLLTAIVLAYTYFTSRTVPGRYFYAVGGNEKAAKLSGINTNRVFFLAYVNMAILSAVAALVCIARFNSAAPTAGQNYEMDAIGACFIGGASAYGGIGTVPGVVIGAIFMGVLNNGMSIMSIDSNVQKAVKGLVLLAAVAFDVITKSSKQK